MLKCKIITIFPGILDSYFQESILKRAQKNKLLKIDYINLRDYASGKHRQVDDKIYGGGVGMLLKIEPLYKALRALKKISAKTKTRVILLAANGRQFTQADAQRLAKYQNLVFVCGRYEGVDARVDKLVDDRFSVGQYVLTGGELPAAIIIDAVSRLLPGVLGKNESSVDETFGQEGLYEYPQYTRPEIFVTKEGKKWRVPKALLSGNHQQIAAWRQGKRPKSPVK